MLIGGGSGPAIVSGNLEESWLYNAITHQDYVMPPKRKLPQNVIDDFRKWIEMGAPDPRVNTITNVKSTITKEDIQQAKNSFWAYQKPVKQISHPVEDKSWSRTDIDRFILAKLDQADLKPAADAESWKVLRRICFDLLGLPPTPAQIEYFTKAWKSDPDRAVAFVVDRLLEKEQFGERWGRYWLDVAHVPFRPSVGLSQPGQRQDRRTDLWHRLWTRHDALGLAGGGRRQNHCRVRRAWRPGRPDRPCGQPGVTLRRKNFCASRLSEYRRSKAVASKQVVPDR